ncbi:MAG: hypothetical protein ACUZ8A_05770, partial [Candidatus Bathyanammoxibius sp.]
MRRMESPGRIPKITLRVLFALSLVIAITPSGTFAMGKGSRFVFAQLEYRGGNWNPRPRAGRVLVWEL